MMDKATRRERAKRKARYGPRASRAFLLVLDQQAAKRDRLKCDPRYCAQCAEQEYR